MTNGNIKMMSVDNLLLDIDNPRLPKNVDRDQSTMLDYLSRQTSIDELVSAIAHNNFFQGEALIAIPSHDEGDKYIVVEGNRRLTALKLLQNPEIADDRPRLHKLLVTAQYRPTNIPVAVYDERNDVLNYLGNRHIAGVKPWAPLAKARYIQQLFDRTDTGGTYEQRCREVASTIGSRRDFIHKSLRALSALGIFEASEFQDFEYLDLEGIKFSLLTTALDYEEIRSYFETSENVILYTPETINHNRLKDIFSYLFVPRGVNGRPPIGESRNLSKLAKILHTPKAVEAFNKGATIDQAYLITAGVNEDFERIFYNIQDKLREASSLAAEIDITDTIKGLIEKIFRQAKSLKQIINEG